MPQVCGVGIPLVQWASDFCEQLRSCSVGPEDGSFLPTLCSQLLRAEGRWHRFVYPWLLFWEVERPLRFGIFPLDRNLEWGKGSISASFYCSYLSSYLRRFFLYLLSLSQEQKKRIKSHYYSLLFLDKKTVKQFIKKFRMGRNLQKHPMIASYFIWYLVDSVSRGGCMEEK